jgi:magnesium transporter
VPEPESELLGVAADHAVKEVPTARPEQSIGEVRENVVGRRFERVADVAVLDGSNLVGILSMEQLLSAEPAVSVAEVMDSDPPKVAPGTDQERVAWAMVDRGESSLAVVDGDGRFVGIIPAHNMLAVLLAEHDEDLARLGGFITGSKLARRAAEEPVAARLWHRIPWLIVGLAGAMLSAVLVGAFEDELDAKVLLTFFVPAIVYMAGAVGAQTVTVIVRGLSAGVPLRAVVWRELITGLVIGAIVGGVFLPFALIVWGEADVAVAIGLALAASCGTATVTAMALPWLFQKLGTDPAFGSGPLATVIQDLLSLIIYFAIAIPLAT